MGLWLLYLTTLTITINELLNTLARVLFVMPPYCDYYVYFLFTKHTDEGTLQL